MATEQIRTIALLVMCGIAFLLWQEWQRDYGPKPQPTQTTARSPAPDAPPADTPSVPGSPGEPATVPAVPGEEPRAVTDALVVKVRTDLLDAEIDLSGATLRRLDLLAYPVSIERPDTPYTLLSPTLPDLFIAQSGLIGKRDAPDHHARFTAPQAEFSLPDGADTVDVPLRWEGSDGLVITKHYRFRRDSYVVEIVYEITNNGAEPWQGNMYGQFQRTEVAQTERLNFVYTYTGGVLSTPEKRYEKFDFDDMRSQDLSASVTDGWAAMIQHYFVGAWIPSRGVTNHYYTKALGANRYVIGAITPQATVAPGETGRLAMSAYIGPKIQERMEQAVEGLELTVDYGVLTIIAQPVFWLLDWVHSLVGNWGWSIVIITILIKALFFHLSATSYKSMARMRKLQPRLLALRERYANDKARLNQAMMELYKTEKVNPLGGCLPILVQIPVFIALYWVLLESVELRQAPFILWIRDLSDHDPYFVLPILMGITMFIQQRLNPAPPDPIQAKIMMALPFVFTFFFLFFPSGLVLYWFVNNVLSIAQQWVITRRMLEDPKA